MKTIFVLRHAKSSWNDPGLSDFERPLNARGLKAAPFMGKLMRERNYVPELIVSSSAQRARQTAELAAEAGAFGDVIRFEKRIYESTPQTLISIAAQIDERISAAMLVGHNPGFEGLVKLLTGELEEMPTAALAVVDLDINSWRKIGPRTGQLRELIRPKQVMHG